MRLWTLIFLALTLIAAILGFGVLTGVAASIAQIMFVIHLAATALAAVLIRVQDRVGV